MTKALSEIKGTNEQVLSFANQMKTLEKILGNSKQRGILGEIQLENLLANVLPPELFEMQHSFSNGEMVDLVKDGVIDPAKVTRSTVENASSIASLVLTTEALIAEEPEPEPPMPPGGGMGGMEGMM